MSIKYKGKTVAGGAGKDATINGENAVEIVAGDNVSIDQQDGTLTISAAGGGGGEIQWEDINGRPDLSNVSALEVVEIQIPAYLWDENNEAEIPVNKILSNESSQLITPIPKQDSYDSYYENDIKCISQDEGSLTFKAETTPTDDVSIYVYIQSAVEFSEDFVGEFVWWSPQMTSNSTPSPYACSASSQLQGQIYHAFDSNKTTFWHSDNEQLGSTLEFDFGKKTYVTGISVLGRLEYPDQAPSNGIIQGSTDGTKWNNIISFNDIPTKPTGISTYYDFGNPVYYRFYRLANMKSNYPVGIGYVAIAEIQFKVLEGSV